MEFSTQVVIDNNTWQNLADIAQTVDRGSWDTLWNYDHLVPPLAELMPHVAPDLKAFEDGDVFEGWSVLSAWAAATKRVRLGVLVTAIPYRNAAVLAKMAATVDHISGGRLELGVGAGWHQGETRAYGLPLGENKEKFARFEEGLEVLRLLLQTPGKERRNFKGQYFQLDDAPFAPGAVNGHIPILIGGGGEKKTIPLAAKYADNYNFFGNVISDAKQFGHKNQVLDKAAEAIGRDPGSIKRSLCLFADIETDEAKAKARREGLGGPFGQEAIDGILFGSPQYIIDGTARIVKESGVNVGEVIFAGLTQRPENYQRFDEEVLKALRPVTAGV